jgi:hypothetical protein
MLSKCTVCQQGSLPRALFSPNRGIYKRLWHCVNMLYVMSAATWLFSNSLFTYSSYQTCSMHLR